MLVNNLNLPAYLNLHGAKPWEVRMVDTLQWWKFGDYKHYTSLHLLANVLDVPTSKTDINGADVQHVYYKEKKKAVAHLKRIEAYASEMKKTDEVNIVYNIL